MDIKRIIESLSPNERKLLPNLEEKNIQDMSKKSNLDKTSVLRSLDYLKDKKIINLSEEKKKIIEIGVNGALYRKKGLPERRLLNLLNQQRIILLQQAQKESQLSPEEFKASIGVLKRKALIELKNGKIVLSASKEETIKKTLEELFLESLPIEYDNLKNEQKYALQSLENRKNLIYIKEEKIIKVELTDIGEKILKLGIKKGSLIEQIDSKILKKE